MASTRLTQNHRSLLYALVNQIVDCPTEIKEEQRAYDLAMLCARAIVESTYPPKDMEIFAKYNRATRDECVNFALPDGDMKQFTFHPGDAPARPSGGNCRGYVYVAGKRQALAIEAWVHAAKRLEKNTEKKRVEYNALIEGSTYFETLVEIWPEAASLSNRIKINLPAMINPEMMARIKADSAARMKRHQKAVEQAA